MNGLVARGLANATVVRAQTNGSTSTVRVADIVPMGDNGVGFLAQYVELRLAREASGWRITNLVTSASPGGQVSA